MLPHFFLVKDIIGWIISTCQCRRKGNSIYSTRKRVAQLFRGGGGHYSLGGTLFTGGGGTIHSHTGAELNLVRMLKRPFRLLNLQEDGLCSSCVESSLSLQTEASQDLTCKGKPSVSTSGHSSAVVRYLCRQRAVRRLCFQLPELRRSMLQQRTFT